MDYILEAILTIAVSVMAAGYRIVLKEIRQQKTEREALKGLLRAQIIMQHMRYMPRGEIPIYALEGVQTMYQAYKTMGGNGTATKLAEEIMNLPVRQG